MARPPNLLMHLMVAAAARAASAAAQHWLPFAFAAPPRLAALRCPLRSPCCPLPRRRRHPSPLPTPPQATARKGLSRPRKTSGAPHTCLELQGVCGERRRGMRRLRKCNAHVQQGMPTRQAGWQHGPSAGTVKAQAPATPCNTCKVRRGVVGRRVRRLLQRQQLPHARLQRVGRALGHGRQVAAGRACNRSGGVGSRRETGGLPPAQSRVRALTEEASTGRGLHRGGEAALRFPRPLLPANRLPLA